MNVNSPNEDPDYLDRMLRENEAAAFLGYSVRALQNWRLRGGGPRYVKVSKRSVRYRRRELLAWANCRLANNTSDPVDPDNSALVADGTSWGQGSSQGPAPRRRGWKGLDATVDA